MKLFELSDNQVKAWAIAPFKIVLEFNDGLCNFFADTPFDKLIIRELDDDETFSMTFDNDIKITHTSKEWCAIYNSIQNEIIASTEY